LKTIAIYTNSSFGGIYQYSIQIGAAYKNHPDIEKCLLFYPKNANLNSDDHLSVLMPDIIKSKNKFVRKLYFLLRTTINPLLFLVKALKYKPDILLLNDFDQFSSFIWTWFYRLSSCKKAIILHDPDRDKFLPVKWLSVISMYLTMQSINYALYHAWLPEKSYYKKNIKCRFIDIPHGIYPVAAPDNDLYKQLMTFKLQGKHLISVPGNIRSEKNYHLIMQAIIHLPQVILVIAGNAANSNIHIKHYQLMAENLKIANRVIFIEKYLTNPELSAVIHASDAVVLYYAPSFTSQSGIFNNVAAIKRKMIVSQTNSALSIVARNYKFANCIPPESVPLLAQAIKKVISDTTNYDTEFEQYRQFASWQSMAGISCNYFFSDQLPQYLKF